MTHPTMPQGWYPDPDHPGQERYWFGQEWSRQSRPVSAAERSGYNQVSEVRYRRGWVGLFAGENQTKALRRAIGELNDSGRVVVATVPDQWSFLTRLGWALVAALTLYFVVRAPNVLLITAPRT
jgi:hypothetical protein